MKKVLITLFTFVIMFFVVGCIEDEGDIPLDDKVIYFEDEHLNILLDSPAILPLVLENVELKDINFDYDDSIISLDKDVVIPITLGSTTLIANHGEISESIEVNVTFIDGNRNLLVVGHSVRLNLVGYDNHDDFSWEVENEEIVQLDNNIANALKPGRTNVVVTHNDDDNIIGKFGLEVILSAPMLATTSSHLQIGGQSQIIITNLDEIGTAIEDYNIDTEDADIVSINEDYIVTASALGKATVTVSLKENSKSFNTIEFNVVTPSALKAPNGEPAEGPLLFDIENPGGIVQAGEELDISIIGGVNNYNYEWRSYDTTVVGATDDGRIIGIKEGRTRVTATSKSDPNIRGEFYVTVVGKPNVNYRDLIVEAALSEEGYVQGPNKKNKFGEWYQYDNVDWCAIFVSWAANQAGVGTDVILRYSLCVTGLDWFDEQGLYHLKGEYTPQKGDIVFFRNPNGRIGHTGIVISADENNVYTIEGNTSGGVFKRTRSLSGTYVDGFASPNYPPFTE